MSQSWRLDTPAQTLVFASGGDMARCAYWGAPLPESEDLATLIETAFIAPTGGVLDVVAPVSACPEVASGFAGQPGATLRRGGPLYPRFRLTSSALTDSALELWFEDQGLRYGLFAEADPTTDVITLWATIEGDAQIEWLAAPVLPGPQLADEILTFSGRWCGEFQTNRVRWRPGAHVTEGVGGRTSHEHFPGVILPTRGATENAGEAFGLHLGWSGGHRLCLEELPSGLRQIQIGASGPTQAPLTTPKLYATRSGAGLNGVSQAFHRQVRKLVRFAEPSRPRPVHYNCWEAVYFDHSFEKLSDLADKAADLGAERFVLDDGWFGRRDDDTSSLGDWWIDDRKWPDGLTPLISHVQSLGMTFGIWFEPEMVNPDSDLYRAHPDWVLGPHDQPTGRQQLVLNLARPEVCDYLFETIDAVLAANAIDYIKWDHNRVLPHPSQAQTHAVYALIDRLRAAHPAVEIESCSSGGGRIDFGILERTQRIWLSDSNDAHERMKIQRGASYFLPPEITGSHVGPRVCHTSHRQLSMAFRARVAGTRAMGMEMDLSELTDAEAAELKAQIDVFKTRRALLHSGSLHRLESEDACVSAEMHVARDEEQFILFAAQMSAPPQQMARPLRLAGLKAEARYSLVLQDADRVVEVMNRGQKNPLVAGETVILSGAALMGRGVQLPNSFPDEMWVVHGRRL